MADKKLTMEDINQLLNILQTRFEKNKHRHDNIEWNDVMQKLQSKTEKLTSLYKMEMSGVEPDVIAFDLKTGEFLFFDCCEESPKGRRSLCYDRAALDSRKENKPANNAADMASEMGIELVTASQYSEFQLLTKFDMKTSSWVKTPESIRKLGGALFCDRRYDTVFTYHNGAESYYAARGFRGILRV